MSTETRSSTSLRSMRSVLEVLDACAEVRIQVRFGTSERWCRLSKVEARTLLASYKANVAVEYIAVDKLEGFNGEFGNFDGHTLYLG